jgi:hypothetical protein
MARQIGISTFQALQDLNDHCHRLVQRRSIDGLPVPNSPVFQGLEIDTDARQHANCLGDIARKLALSTDPPSLSVLAGHDLRADKVRNRQPSRVSLQAQRGRFFCRKPDTNDLTPSLGFVFLWPHYLGPIDKGQVLAATKSQ